MPLPPKQISPKSGPISKLASPISRPDMLKVAMGVAIAVILANATMTIALIRFLA